MLLQPLRKFFNIDAPETPSTPTDTSIASILAQHGRMNTGTTAEVPSINTEKKEEATTPATEQTPVDTTTSTPQADTANQESPTPSTEQPVETPTPQVAEVPTVVPAWQEVLKQQQPEAIFKELGYDVGVVGAAKTLSETPQLQGLIQHWQANGDVVAYLREMTTDYSKMPAEDVMLHQLRREYPKATEAQLKVLYEDEIVQRYKLDPDIYSESEVERGKMLLEAKAERYRDELVENQKQFLIPKAPEPKAAEPVNEVVDTSAQEAEIRSFFTEHPYTKSVLSNKVISIGEGEDKFNFPIQDPNALSKVLYDNQEWVSLMYSQQGDKLVPNVEKQFLVAAFAKDPEGFIRELGKHYKALGGKAALDPIENLSQPNGNNPSKTAAPPQTVAEAMAKQGILR